MRGHLGPAARSAPASRRSSRPGLRRVPSRSSRRGPAAGPRRPPPPSEVPCRPLPRRTAPRADRAAPPRVRWGPLRRGCTADWRRRRRTSRCARAGVAQVAADEVDAERQQVLRRPGVRELAELDGVDLRAGDLVRDRAGDGPGPGAQVHHLGMRQALQPACGQSITSCTTDSVSGRGNEDPRSDGEFEVAEMRDAGDVLQRNAPGPLGDEVLRSPPAPACRPASGRAAGRARRRAGARPGVRRRRAGSGTPAAARTAVASRTASARLGPVPSVITTVARPSRRWRRAGPVRPSRWPTG